MRAALLARGHLGDVDEGALGAGLHHANNIVGLLQADLGSFAGIITGLVQGHVDMPLECLHHGTACLRLQVVDLGFGNQLAHLHFGLQQQEIISHQPAR